MIDKHESVRVCASATRRERLRVRIVRFASASLALAVFVIVAFPKTICMAQRQENATNATNAAPLFVPTLDLHSPTYYSSVDAARKDRPPEPAKVSEELYYPDGFLTLSSPTPLPVAKEKPSKIEKEMPEKSAKKVDRGDHIRPLDPSVETTPLTVEPRVKKETQEEPIKRSRKDRFFFFAVSVALAGLGVFIYNDFRYRDQLRADLVRNAKLCSPNATPEDFEGVLAEDVDLTDPRAPSYVNPHYDADVVLYADPDKAGKILSDPAFDDYRFEASSSHREHFGPGLGDENFDFAPSGDSGAALEDEEEAEFNVGAPSVAYSQSTVATD